MGLRFRNHKGTAKVVQSIRKIRGVFKADALFGTPDVIVLVEGSDVGTMNSVIDKIALVPKVLGTHTRVARWLQ